MTHRNHKGQFIDGNNPASVAHRFTAERLKGNQHAKGNPANKTSFTPEHCQDKHPSWRGGIQKTKDGYYISYASTKRMPLARYIWLQHNGEIPEGHIIIHRDGDKYNDDIENLEAITRAEHVIRNKNK